LLGGKDLRCYPLPELRGLFSLVSQDVFLFSDSVRENIRLGRAGASDAEVKEAATKPVSMILLPPCPGVMTPR
jgi:ABC-type multidrug transport system fused ATPase/permease subunit